MKETPMTDYTTEERPDYWDMDRQCPGCSLNWCLYPPAHIYGLPMVRCVECKRVYDEATGSEVNAD